MYACKYINNNSTVEAVKLLLNAGADINMINNCNLMAIDYIEDQETKYY